MGKIGALFVIPAESRFAGTVNYGFMGPFGEPIVSSPRETTKSTEDSKPCHNPVTIPYRDVSGLYLHVFIQIQEHYTRTTILCQLFSVIYLAVNNVFCFLTPTNAFLSRTQKQK